MKWRRKRDKGSRASTAYFFKRGKPYKGGIGSGER